MNHPIHKNHILLYEVHASPWMKYAQWGWLQSLCSWWLAWKVHRKYRRYVRSIAQLASLPPDTCPISSTLLGTREPDKEQTHDKSNE